MGAPAPRLEDGNVISPRGSAFIEPMNKRARRALRLISALLPPMAVCKAALLLAGPEQKRGRGWKKIGTCVRAESYLKQHKWLH